MRYFISALCFLCLCISSSASGQQTAHGERWHVVAIPPEIMMAVAMPQPDCPLKIEKLTAIRHLDGNLAGYGGNSYELRNRGTKPIRAYKVASFITSLEDAGSVSEVEWRGGETSEWLMPGQATPRPGEGHEAEFVPLTEELRDKLKLRGPMKGVLYFMVVRVEFADGTTYSDEKMFKALEAFQNSLGLKLDRN